MIWLLIAVSALFAATAYALFRRYSPEPGPRSWTLLRVAAILLIGLAAAVPFATPRAVGSGEAYNYSLALADGITQMRAGVLPPLVGQTKFAFNGRVHPLRSAPYLFYMADALDLLTGRRLTFWELQNLSLFLSLIGAAFICYASLRWSVACPRPAALLLTAAYVLSPALLAAAHSIDLYMTVHAAVFVPAALALCLRQGRDPKVRHDLDLAAVLAAAWLAHPPVAAWLTLAVAFLRGLIWLRRPSWRAALGLLPAVAVAAALSAFVFASVAALNASLAMIGGSGVTPDMSTRVILALERSALPGSLLPVSSGTDLLGDLQLGYAHWLLLLAVLAAIARPGRFKEGRRDPAWLAASGLSACAVLLLLLVFPVPGLTEWLWLHVPIELHQMTNVWPMQRLYLLATGSIVFAAGSVPWARCLPRSRHRMARFLVAAAAVWTLWQALPFIRRGFDSRWTEDDTRRSHLASNLDLTITSYAFLGLPPTFVHGVMDPEFEFRILRGSKEIASPLATALRVSPVVARGILRLDGKPEAGFAVYAPQIVLQPHRRYLLTLDFLIPPQEGQLTLTGPSLRRRYYLPDAGEPLGFGMEAGHTHSLPLYTVMDRPEKITLGLAAPRLAARRAQLNALATFTLQEVPTGRLPVRLLSLLPLCCVVDAPESGSSLVTCRRYIGGYEAAVNGHHVSVRASPDGAAMVPVPKGQSLVELTYEGPWFLRAAFDLTAAAWILYLASLGVRLFRPAETAPAALPFRPWFARHRPGFIAIVTGIVAADIAVAAVLGFHAFHKHWETPGPIHLQLMLPSRAAGRREAIASLGPPDAVTIVLIEYLDDMHLRIGADIWGGLFWSEPLQADTSRPQDLTIDSNALYPLDDPAIWALDPALRSRLRRGLRLEWNDRTVLVTARNSFESRLSEIAIGSADVRVSHADPPFSGKIIHYERLPLPHALSVGAGRSLRLKLPVSGLRGGEREPLFSVGGDGSDGLLYARRLAGGRLLLGFRSGTGRTTESAPLPAPRDAILRLDGSVGRERSDSPDYTPSVRIGGRPVLGLEPDRLIPPAHSLLFVAGLNFPNAPDVDARAAITDFKPRVVSDGNSKEAIGPAALFVVFPRDRTGGSEPLVVSGLPGAGDFVYVRYTDGGHVCFGADHWKVGGPVTPPIPVDYTRPHLIVVRMGSLYPDAQSPAWAAASPAAGLRAKSGLTVLFDNRIVLEAPFSTYPAAPDSVTLGRNPIGGSTCGAEFTGPLLLAYRLGLDRSH